MAQATRRVVGRWWQSLNQQNYYKSAAYATWYLQTFITSAHCIVDLSTAYYPFGIFQTFITSGHCVVDLPTAYYPFGIFQTFITRLDRTNSMVK
jgi:hypothetical protein